MIRRVFVIDADPANDVDVDVVHIHVDVLMELLVRKIYDFQFLNSLPLTAVSLE